MESHIVRGSEMMKHFILWLLCAFAVMCPAVGQGPGKVLFSDDFENGTTKWELNNPAKIQVIDSGDPAHGHVLSLHAGGHNVHALIVGSRAWTDNCIPRSLYASEFRCRCSHGRFQTDRQ